MVVSSEEAWMTIQRLDLVMHSLVDCGLNFLSLHELIHNLATCSSSRVALINLDNISKCVCYVINEICHITSI